MYMNDVNGSQAKLFQKYRQIFKGIKLTDREIEMLHEHFITMVEVLLSNYNKKGREQSQSRKFE